MRQIRILGLRSSCAHLPPRRAGIHVQTHRYSGRVNHGNGSASVSLAAPHPDGSVVAFLDESFAPVVAAGAVVMESSDVLRMGTDIAATYDKVKNWYHLGGMPSFEEFRKRGFHATNDPYEVRAAFVAFLSESLNFKSLIVYSDGSIRDDLSDKKRFIIVLDRLIRDVLGAYRSRPKITFYFESAQAMDKYTQRVVARAVQSFGRHTPNIEVRFGTKRQPELLAVPDYVLHIFNQWLSAQDGDGLLLQAGDHRSRSFKAILGSVSSARSLDDGRVVRRTLQ